VWLVGETCTDCGWVLGWCWEDRLWVMGRGVWIGRGGLPCERVVRLYWVMMEVLCSVTNGCFVGGSCVGQGLVDVGFWVFLPSL
jgi:hypothetical protein